MFNFLIDATDTKSRTRQGRIRHGLFCTVMAVGLILVSFVGGWIATAFFKGVLLLTLSLVGGFADAEGHVRAWIWVPIACAVFLLWVVFVVLPAFWAALNAVAAVLGIATAIRPQCAASPAVIWLANAAATLAKWSMLGPNK